jgi:hypothetical protein
MVQPNFFEGNRFVIPPFGLGTPPEFTPAPLPVPAPISAPAVVLTPEQRRYVEQQIADADAGGFGFSGPETTMGTAGPSVGMATDPVSGVATDPVSGIATTSQQDFGVSPGFSAPASSSAFSRDSVMEPDPQGFNIGPEEIGRGIGFGVGAIGGPGALAGSLATGALGGQVTPGDVVSGLGKTGAMALGGPLGMGISALAGGIGSLVDVAEANKGIESFNRDMQGFVGPGSMFTGVDPVDPISGMGKVEAFARGALGPITAPLSMFDIEPFAGPKDLAKEAYEKQQEQFEEKGFDRLGYDLDPMMSYTPTEEGPMGLAADIGLGPAMDALGKDAFTSLNTDELAETIGTTPGQVEQTMASYGVDPDPTSPTTGFGFDFDFDMEAEAVEDEPGQEGLSDPSDFDLGAEDFDFDSFSDLDFDPDDLESDIDVDIDTDPDSETESSGDLDSDEDDPDSDGDSGEGEGDSGEGEGEGEGGEGDGSGGGSDADDADDADDAEHDGGKIVKKTRDKKRRNGLKGDEVERILQTGEFVIQRKSADKLGKAALEKINAGKFDTLKLYNALGIKPNGRNRTKRGFQRKRA